MTKDQVHVAYAALPEPLYLGDDNPNIPPNLDSIEYEIVRFTAEEVATLRAWMTQNPDNYIAGEIRGEAVYLLGGFGSGRPGKGDRLATSLHAILADNIVVRVSHKSLFSQLGGLEPSPLVVTVMGDIIDRSKQANK
jgi:type IV secretory pathway ATPase VirB11/archaellum biosynthesis ATPase